MINHMEEIQSFELFKGINSHDLKPMLDCIGAGIIYLRKGDIALLEGNKSEHIGVVLAGQMDIVREDCEGNRSLISTAVTGEIFAETLCCADIPESPVTVISVADSIVMLLDFPKILHICNNTCKFHSKLIANMVKLIAEKNLFLETRMTIVSLKSIRAKVLRYLESLGAVPGTELKIPLNREEMAEYLCVDRSALSHELSKMRNEDLLEYKKNSFLLK